MTEQIDWLDDLQEDKRQALPADDHVQMLRNLADHYETMEWEISNAEALLNKQKEDFRRLREEIIPDRMQEFGVKKLVLDDGSTLSYAEFYAAKVLNDEGFDWLEANGYADAVKQELKLEVSRVDSRVLAKIKEWVAKMIDADDPEGFDNLSVKEKQAVHHMTLGAAVKQLSKSGKELPKDLFETYIGTRATLKKGKSNE